MKKTELKNCPQWLLDADTENEDVDFDHDGILIWKSGNFWGGNFRGGDFWGGDFRGGNFRGGDFWGGNFRGGNFWGGDFWGGNFRGGDFWGGDFRGGNFRGGDFRGGNFWGGDFRGGNFRGGDFWGQKISKAPTSIYGLRWLVVIGGTQMHIGCERHEIDDWRDFDDARINKMDRGALKFWRANKTALLALCDALQGNKS